VNECAAGSVKELALELWVIREEQPRLGQLDPMKWSRRLARTVAAECDAKPHWDPEDSAVVLWIRAVVAAKSHGMEKPRANDRLEASCAMLIGKLEEWNGDARPEDARRKTGGAASDEEPEWLREPRSIAVVQPTRPPPERCGKDRACGRDD